MEVLKWFLSNREDVMSHFKIFATLRGIKEKSRQDAKLHQG